MTTSVTFDYLTLGELPHQDDSIDKREWQEHSPININADNPNIQITYSDQWTLPSEAYIQITGEIVKNADGSSYGDGDKVGLVNNGPMFLFKRLTYKIDKQVVEEVTNPGVASLMTSLVDYSDDYLNVMGEQLIVIKDTAYNDTENTNTGFVKRKSHKKFGVCIPLKHIFGFARGFNKVVYGVNHALDMLIDNAYANALYRKNDVDAAKVKLSRLSLWMPRVHPSPKSSVNLFDFIKSGKKLRAPFQRVQYHTNQFVTLNTLKWNIAHFDLKDRPRHVFVALQLQDKNNDQAAHNGIFDPCALTTISLKVNGTDYPNQPYLIKLANKEVGRPYMDLLGYKSFIDRYNSGMLITKSDFMARYPVYHFNLEQMPDLSTSTSMFELEAKLAAGGAYDVHVVISADCDTNFYGEGARMRLKMTK